MNARNDRYLAIGPEDTYTGNYNVEKPALATLTPVTTSVE